MIGSVASWGRLQTVMEPLESMLKGRLQSPNAILTKSASNLELSWALLAPIGTKTNALTTRGSPPPEPREGVGGRGKPLPGVVLEGGRG